MYLFSLRLPAVPLLRAPQMAVHGAPGGGAPMGGRDAGSDPQQGRRWPRFLRARLSGRLLFFCHLYLSYLYGILMRKNGFLYILFLIKQYCLSIRSVFIFCLLKMYFIICLLCFFYYLFV